LFPVDREFIWRGRAAAVARVAEVAERLAMTHADRAFETDHPKIEASATAAFQKATRVLRRGESLREIREIRGSKHPLPPARG
jgi:hypothetical protein